jgi:hypothetical protein
MPQSCCSPRAIPVNALRKSRSPGTPTLRRKWFRRRKRRQMDWSVKSQAKARAAKFPPSLSFTISIFLGRHGSISIGGTSAGFQLSGLLGENVKTLLPSMAKTEDHHHAGRSTSRQCLSHRPRIALPSCCYAAPYPHGRHDIVYGKTKEVELISIYWRCVA